MKKNKKNKNIYGFIGIFIIVFSMFSFTTVALADQTVWYYYTGIVPVQKGNGPFIEEEECINSRQKFIENRAYADPSLTECQSSIIAGSPVPQPKEPELYKIEPGKTIKHELDYKLLAPIGDKEVIRTDDIGKYFNILFNIALGLAGALAVIMIVIGGVQWMGDESIFGKTEAKKKITQAILGLLIALGAFALLNTINPDLLGGKGLNIDSVTIKLDPDVYGDTPHSAVNGYYCNGRAKAGESWGDDTDERKAVKSAGISVQRSNSCSKVGDQNCTSLERLETSKVINFKKLICPECEVVINGGTECWLHSPGTEHYKDNPIVDLDDTASMDEYVKSGDKKKVENSSFNTYTKDGIMFLDEGNHYHIVSW